MGITSGPKRNLGWAQLLPPSPFSMVCFPQLLFSRCLVFVFLFFYLEVHKVHYTLLKSMRGRDPWADLFQALQWNQQPKRMQKLISGQNQALFDLRWSIHDMQDLRSSSTLTAPQQQAAAAQPQGTLVSPEQKTASHSERSLHKSCLTAHDFCRAQ